MPAVLSQRIPPNRRGSRKAGSRADCGRIPFGRSTFAPPPSAVQIAVADGGERVVKLTKSDEGGRLRHSSLRLFLKRSAIDRFLRFLQVERNAAALTVKSYREDLAAWTTISPSVTDARPSRGDLAARSAGYVLRNARSGLRQNVVARRLASLRTFFKFAHAKAWRSRTPRSRSAIRGRIASCRTF